MLLKRLSFPYYIKKKKFFFESIFPAHRPILYTRTNQQSNKEKHTSDSNAIIYLFLLTFAL
jgi:hypothetical protein